MDGEREEAIEAAAKATATHWRGAVRALAREPLPHQLREALVELGAQGYRLSLAVEAYGARLDAMWGQPEEMARPARLCREWPEYRERAAAKLAYDSAADVVASLARAWVEGRAAGGAS